jgi:hypothetical protein
MAVSLAKSWRTLAGYIVGVPMFVLFAYGAGRFSDGPISECGSGFCSSHHQPHSADDYRAYKAWEKIIFIVWPLGMAAGFLLQYTKPKDDK